MPSNESVDDNTHSVRTDSHDTDSVETSHAEKKTRDQSWHGDEHHGNASTLDQTIAAQATTLTSPTGCSTGHSSQTNFHAQTATPLKLRDTTASKAETETNSEEKAKTLLEGREG